MYITSCGSIYALSGSSPEVYHSCAGTCVQANTQARIYRILEFAVFD